MRIKMADYDRDDVAALIRAVLAFGRRLRSERASGRVTSSAASMLNTLHMHGPMPARQLASEERLQPQSLTRIVKRLEEDGLISRKRSEADQRELVIALTDLGTRELDADLLAHQQWLELVVREALSASDRALLDDVVRVLLKIAFHESDPTAQGKEMPSWVQYAIFWQIYPLGFVGAPTLMDASGAVSHRLDRIVDLLDYAVDLGVSALLLNPIFASATHGYDTIDHFRIDPRLGDETDFDRLIAAANQRGLRIVLDGVFNHVGRDFPRFVEAEAKGRGSDAAQWFCLVDGDASGARGKWTTFEGQEGLITLNHDNPEVAEYVADVMTHWLDRGVSGWRLDAAYATPRSFWKHVLPRVRQSHPDAYFFGEVIHGDYAGFVQDGGVDAAVVQLRDQARGQGLADVQVEAVELCRQVPHQPGQQVGRDGRDDAQPQPPDVAALHAAGEVAQLVDGAQDLRHAFAEGLAESGQPDGARPAFEERQAKFGLQLLDLHRKRGLGDRAGRGSVAEMPFLGERLEIAQLFQGDVLHNRKL